MTALAALLAIGTAIGAGDLFHSASRTLRGTDVAGDLAFGIQAQVGGATPPPVSCPSSEPVRQGYRFRCTATVHGSVQTVDVVEIDPRGHLRWRLVGR